MSKIPKFLEMRRIIFLIAAPKDRQVFPSLGLLWEKYFFYLDFLSGKLRAETLHSAHSLIRDSIYIDKTALSCKNEITLLNCLSIAKLFKCSPARNILGSFVLGQRCKRGVGLHLP